MSGRRARVVGAAAVALGVFGGGLEVVAAPQCASPPPPVRDIALPRFYNDAAGSAVDKDLAAAHKAAVAPLTDFLRRVVADTDKALARRDAALAACPLSWIATWAKGEAWLGAMHTKQAEYQRKWDHAGIALAYLKLKPYATKAQQAVIEAWLIRFADVVAAFQNGDGRKRNNHVYWMGLGQAATALATGSERHWAAARAVAQEAAGQIGRDGTLPLELERGARALHYHTFGVTPLVVMAELAAGRGEDWYGLRGGALHRLVAASIGGLADPSRFDALAGVRQERPLGTGAGWLALYTQRFGAPPDAGSVEVPTKHRWLGGDVRHLPVEARRRS
jgi:poly(beta-D-mannuronate) lyase